MEPVGLTPREWQLVECLSRGLPNKAIARELGISEGTAKVYLSHLWRRLPGDKGVNLRLKLALDFLAGKFCLGKPRRAYTRLVHSKAAPIKPSARVPSVSPEQAEAFLNRRRTGKAGRKLTPDEERWNRIYDERFAHPSDTGLIVRHGSSLTCI